MQPRQLLIITGVAIVAFAVAFGVAGASGGEDSKAAGAGLAPAEVIEVEDADVTAGVSGASGLPALQVPKKKKPKEEPVTAASPSTGTTISPSTGTTTPAPSTSTTPTTSTSPPPSTNTTPPASSNPAPQTGGETPIQTGGGED